MVANLQAYYLGHQTAVGIMLQWICMMAGELTSLHCRVGTDRSVICLASEEAVHSVGEKAASYVPGTEANREKKDNQAYGNTGYGSSTGTGTGYNSSNTTTGYNSSNTGTGTGYNSSNTGTGTGYSTSTGSGYTGTGTGTGHNSTTGSGYNSSTAGMTTGNVYQKIICFIVQQESLS